MLTGLNFIMKQQLSRSAMEDFTIVAQADAIEDNERLSNKKET
jgi:hypothetical protein